MTKIRIACCLVRCLTDAQMREVFKISLNQFW